MFAPDVTLLGSGIDPDAARWIATVGVANVTQPRGRLISDTIRELKAANVWADLDYLGVYTAENAASALVDWRARKTATLPVAPTFTADLGYAFNGTTQYLATAFTPSTDCVAATGTSFMLGAYERANVSSSGNIMGAANAVAQSARFISRSGSNVLTSVTNAAGVGLGSSLTDSRGLTTVVTDGVNGSAYRDGVITATSPAALTTPGSSLTSREIFIGCYNNNGSAATFRATTIGYAMFGRNGWTAAQHLTFYNIMQRFETKLGANV
jgi:hypothetical protein